MQWYYNTKTRKKISESDYKKLSDDEKALCRPWRDKPPRSEEQDYAWYNVDDKISEAVANVPFNRFPGNHEQVDILWKGSTTKIPDTKGGSTVTPGVMEIDYIPTYGMSHDANSALNMAARGIYTWVRHQNSGRTNYEAPDLMLYIAAMDQVLTCFAACQRAYAAAMTYSYESRYIPDSIIRACGFDPADLRANLANFRYGLNLRAAKISSMLIPKKFNIYKRHVFLALNVFTDSDTLRGQFYLFKPKQYLQYSATKETTGGSLQGVSWGATAKTAAQALVFLDSLLDPILQDEDMNIMSGDILKAYGRENCYSLDFVAEAATLSFVFNEDVLSQIENMIPYTSKISSAAADNVFTITQTSTTSTDNYLKTSDQRPEISADYQLEVMYFNSHKKDPNYKDVLEWSRCSCLLSFGTELIRNGDVKIWVTVNGTPTSRIVQQLQTITASTMPESGSALLNMYQTYAQLQCFDWHPAIYFVVNDVTGTNPVQSYAGKWMDLKVYTLIDFNQIQLMHDAAVMGAINGLTMSST